jgi:hypothetical protein
VTITDGGALSVVGSVIGTTVGLSGSSIDILGSVSGPSSVLLTANPGSITEAGSVTSALLTGSAGTSAVLTGSNTISSFGPFSVSFGTINLVNSLPLTINGPLSANRIAISATDSISLTSALSTGAVTNGGGASFTLMPAANGNSSFQAATDILPMNGSSASLTVTMPSKGGNIDFTNLDGPSTDIVLNLGGGSAAGKIDVGNLTVNGSGGTVTFTGSTVQGFSGSAAAAAAQSNPPNNPAYLVNGCEIGVGCVTTLLSGLAAGVTVSSGIGKIVDALIDDATTAAFQDSQQDSLRGLPFLNPMRDLAGGPLRDRQNDPDLLLPNVSEKDY